MKKTLLVFIFLFSGCMTNEERIVVYPKVGKAAVTAAKWYYFGFDK